MLRDLILKNRSARKYYEDVTVSRETLVELVDLARLSASGGNRQLLKYYLSCEPHKNAVIYSHIGLGGNPPEGERPSAYIIILSDTSLGLYGPGEVDQGIAAQSILLGATERGLGGCMVGMVYRKELRKALSIPERYDILLVLTLGKPKGTAVIEDLSTYTDKQRGWWDEQGRWHIPKRKLSEIIIG
jgi:nitroreductase